MTKSRLEINKYRSGLVSPILFILAFVIVFGLILFNTYSHIKNDQTVSILKVAERISNRIDFKLKGNLNYLSILANERANGRLTESKFSKRVEYFLHDHTEFINITWIDSNFIIQTVTPLEGNEVIIGLPIELPEPKLASRKAKESKVAIYTNPFEAIQTKPSIEVWVPVFTENDVFLGLFAGVYSCDELLKSCIPEEPYEPFRVSLVGADSSVLESYTQSNLLTNGQLYDVDIKSLKDKMSLRIEADNEPPFDWVMIMLVTLIFILVMSYAYSLVKISYENNLRKETQLELEKREITLQKQNKDFIDLNNEYKEQNKNLIVANKKAEESDKLKSAFLANMSHEIRTPMNGILGFAGLLKEPEIEEEDKNKYIDIIERSGHRMLNIINDIIDISKIESGLMGIHLSSLNMNELLEYIYTFFKPEADTKGLEFVFIPLDSDHENIITDREKFIAIFTNLVKNAIKYTHSGRIEFGGEKVGESIEFYVRDTGIGIPELKQKVVFERFIQTDSEEKLVQEGAGLGLAISKSFVDLLSGEIWLKSEEGVGSTFYFKLEHNTDSESV